MSIRIFIADDHPVVRDGLRLTIERSGKDIVTVGEVSDGMEVLKMARTRPADVYILDVTMPNLNGIETARELLKKTPAAKIIMLSLHDTKALVEEALAITPGTPTATNAGKLTNEPPPAMAFIVPAPNPARNSSNAAIIADA